MKTSVLLGVALGLCAAAGSRAQAAPETAVSGMDAAQSLAAGSEAADVYDGAKTSGGSHTVTIGNAGQQTRRGLFKSLRTGSLKANIPSPAKGNPEDASDPESTGVAIGALVGLVVAAPVFVKLSALAGLAPLAGVLLTLVACIVLGGVVGHLIRRKRHQR